jgi:molecular chaperone DnaJ
MPPTKDLYEILGVPRTATQDEIRKAYLKLAHKFHPDKTGGDPEAEQRLKEVNAAYDVLKNAEKRKQYDRFGEEGNPFGGGGFGGGGGAGFEAPFEDFFDMLFGQGGRRGGGGARAQQGRDLEMGVTVSLKEAATGVKKTIRFNRKETCTSCRGSGAAPGTQPEACSQCGGAGQVRATHGFFAVNRVCPRCGGSGRFIPKPCRSCGGNGMETAKRELEVEIPAGIESGHQLRVTGEGEPGPNNGPRGSLYLAITVEPHEVFKRDGTTITCDVPISFTQAALGDKIRVPTLDGEADITVPAGTQSGTQFRLRGLGMPDLRGYRQGDQIVEIKVETPTKLSKRQKELLEEFQELSDHKNYPLYRRFLDRFKL